jgi:magnesium-transporting ATPase (P-type)
MFEMLNTQTPEKKFTFISLGVDRTGQHGKLKYSNRIIFREENIWNAYIIFIPIIIIIIYEINIMLTFNWFWVALNFQQDLFRHRLIESYCAGSISIFAYALISSCLALNSHHHLLQGVAGTWVVFVSMLTASSSPRISRTSILSFVIN